MVGILPIPASAPVPQLRTLVLPLNVVDRDRREGFCPIQMRKGYPMKNSSERHSKTVRLPSTEGNATFDLHTQPIRQLLLEMSHAATEVGTWFFMYLPSSSVVRNRNSRIGA